MIRIFDIGEQLSELDHATRTASIPGIQRLMSHHWARFMEWDAKQMLRARFFQPNPTRRLEELYRLLVEVNRDDWVSSPDYYEALPVVDFTDTTLTTVVAHAADGEGITFAEVLDNFLDEHYYEIGIEITDFIRSGVQKGEVWTCGLVGRSLHFSFVCQRSAIEASLVAAGGDWKTFITHLTS